MNRISAKPYKQWCKSRGIDFDDYMMRFPLLWPRLEIGILMARPEVKKKEGWFKNLKRLCIYVVLDKLILFAKWAVAIAMAVMEKKG